MMYRYINDNWTGGGTGPKVGDEVIVYNEGTDPINGTLYYRVVGYHYFLIASHFEAISNFNKDGELITNAIENL